LPTGSWITVVTVVQSGRSSKISEGPVIAHCGHLKI